MIHAVICEPEGEPAGIVQVLHGVSEHTGRYMDFAEKLAERGYIFCAEDHLGHGKTESEQGWFDERYGWRKICADAVALGNLVKRRYPGLDFFMFGHSMGSFMARTILANDSIETDGIILSGTGDPPPALLSAGKALACVEKARLRSSKGASDLLDAVIFGTYDKKFPGSQRCAWISSDTKEVRKYLSDPLCGFKMSAGMAYDLLDGISYAINPYNIEASFSTLVPVLFVSGREDPVGDMGKGVARSACKFINAGFSDVRVILYDGARHEILHDKCADRAMRDILGWLDARRAEIASGKSRR